MAKLVLTIVMNGIIVCCRGVFYSPEELIAMILQKAKEYSETFAGTMPWAV